MAGSLDRRNIIVGAARIYLGPSGSNRPALGAGSYATTLDEDATWRNVGYTQEGFELAYEPDYGDVEVDQIMDSALTFKQGMRVSVNVTLAEATLYNLMVAWGQASNTLTSTASTATLDVVSDELGAAPVERGLIAVGPGAHGRATTSEAYPERVFHAFRAINVDSTTVASRRSENMGIPVSLRCLPDDNGKYGTMTDRKRTW